MFTASIHLITVSSQTVGSPIRILEGRSRNKITRGGLRKTWQNEINKAVERKETDYTKWYHKDTERNGRSLEKRPQDILNSSYQWYHTRKTEKKTSKLIVVFRHVSKEKYYPFKHMAKKCWHRSKNRPIMYNVGFSGPHSNESSCHKRKKSTTQMKMWDHLLRVRDRWWAKWLRSRNTTRSPMEDHQQDWPKVWNEQLENGYNKPRIEII